MESQPPQNAPRKLKFAPKAPPRRVPKPEVKTENAEDTDAVKAMNLMKQFQERSLKTRPKAEKKVHASQIAFGFGASSTSLRSFGAPKRVDRGQDSASNGAAPGLSDKEYVEPWDYYGYYPVTLPMRRPYSGNPATLDEQEFYEDSASATYDEDLVNHAEELGLLEESVEPTTLFLQLPPTLPMMKRPATADGQVTDSSRPSGGANAMEKTCRLNELPAAGFMGKMLVYRSGAVKLKLGDTLYNVAPGMNRVFAQDVVAMNRSEKHCCAVTEIDKRATVTPDIDAILSSVDDLY